MPCVEMNSVAFVNEFDDLITGPVREFVNCSKKIGGEVAEVGKLVESLFITQKAFLVAAAASQKPADADFAKVLEPTGKGIQTIISFRESHRTSPFFNHLSAVSESIPALSWVAVSPTPGPYVKEMGDAAMFYTNRVLKDFKEKDRIHVDWVQNLNAIYKDLLAYIKLHHTTGVSWNPRGGSIVERFFNSSSSGGVPPPPPSGGAPPPPPPPMMMSNFDSGKSAGDDGRAKLFEEINKGLDITSSLKKVSDDMKTHKNPALREGPKPFVKASGDSSSGKVAGRSPVAVAKPPRVVLDGKKWFVEFQKGNNNLVMSEVKMEHSVYIFKCENTVVQIKGKVKSVIMDSCKKTAVAFDSLVSACEIVNCQSCKMQVMGTVPTISIEKTDGCQVFLSEKSLGVEIVTAKSSEMNVMIPDATSGEFVECPVPEQFKSTVVGNKLRTIIAEKVG